MGKRKAVSSKKAWTKLDTSEVEVAVAKERNSLLRSADPEHKKVGPHSPVPDEAAQPGGGMPDWRSCRISRPRSQSKWGRV